jgi:ATP-binding cassette, subfamily B, bacterial MsbA
MNHLLRLMSYGRKYWPQLLISVVLMALAGAAQSMVPLLIQPVFDRVLVPNAPEGRIGLLPPGSILGRQIYLDSFLPFRGSAWTMIASALLLAFFLKGFCDYMGNYLVSYAGYASVTRLRNAVFDKVLKQGAEFFEAHSTGQLMSSIMNDVDKVQVATSQILADLLRQFFSALFLLYVLFSRDPWLALICLVVVPAVMLPTMRMGKRIRRTSRNTQERQADINQILQETLSGHMVVKAFTAEAYESRRFQEASGRLFRTNVRYVLQQGLSSPVVDFCAALTIVGLLHYARLQIKGGGNFTVGTFTGFLTALLMLLEPLKRLVGIYNIFQQALGASQKVFEYLDHRESIADTPGALRLAGFTQAIEFENVGFHYPGSPDGFRFQGLNLEVKAGEVVALVGPSGGGKTTIANLVPRFYDPSSGSVKIDGRDVRSVSLESLRDQIGLVAQDTFLFNDTIANNIAYGREVPLEAIRAAAKTALANDFIELMPEGYQTVIGDRGVKLSGGQRQRLSIARALLKNAPILILDEATSHLDTESEMLVQKALANLMEHRTVIVIAHRLSTIRRADKIVVLEKGQIRETGTHDELMAQGGIYQRLHELQFEAAGSVVDQ